MKVWKTGLTLLAVCMFFCMGRTAAAAEKISIDFQNLEMYVKNYEDAEVLIGYGSFNKSKKLLTVSNESVYDNTSEGITASLSNLNFDKENYITVRGITEGYGNARIIHIMPRLKVAGIASSGQFNTLPAAAKDSDADELTKRYYFFFKCNDVMKMLEMNIGIYRNSNTQSWKEEIEISHRADGSDFTGIDMGKITWMPSNS